MIREDLNLCMVALLRVPGKNTAQVPRAFKKRKLRGYRTGKTGSLFYSL
jgi:hypothetical protein